MHTFLTSSGIAVTPSGSLSNGLSILLSDESNYTAKAMGQGFIDNIDELFKHWKPQPRFSVTKIDDSIKLNNSNPHPISLTPEFIKEIQSI